jgi:hypothetical protein
MKILKYGQHLKKKKNPLIVSVWVISDQASVQSNYTVQNLELFRRFGSTGIDQYVKMCKKEQCFIYAALAPVMTNIRQNV